MLFVIVVDAPVVHQCPHHATRSSIMLEMTNLFPIEEEGPLDEVWDQEECDENLLVNFIKKEETQK